MSDPGVPAGDVRYRDEYLDVSDGLRLHYRDYPGDRDGPPLLCLHGLTRNARDFEHLAERHSPKFRIILLEFRGRGLSDADPLPMRYNPLTYAGDVLQLLDSLQVPRAIFVGTSLGGLVTMAIAGLAPQRIAASVLNDVGPELGQTGVDRIMRYLGKDVRFATWEAAATAIAANQGASFPDYAPSHWLEMARRNCRETADGIVFDYDPAIAVPFRTNGPTPKVDLWPLFAALADKPLLVVRGELSELLTDATFTKMQQVAPGADFVTVPRTGHAPELSEPVAAAAIDAFVANLSG